MNATQEIEVVPDDQQPLIQRGSGYSISIAPSYQKKKADLLKSAGLIARVNNSEDDAAAAEEIAKLASMRITIEKSRKERKAPAIDYGSTVDETAKTFSAELVAEETRLKKARGEYAMIVEKERQRVLAEMEAARQAEAKRIRDEEAAAAKIEAARIAAEKAMWEADSDEDETAAAKAVEDAKAAELKRLEEAAKVITAPATVAFVPAAPKGVKMVPDFVTLCLHELYQANPQLVTLTERRKEILEFIAAHCPAGVTDETLPSIPGLQVFLKAQVR